MNLLEKANIITTATAYDNGKLHSVKGGEVADFDVVRGSAATRVTAQGLVENVQILSSNLVQNPSFSEEGVQEVSNGSFSQEGVELVTNGSFDNGGANWNVAGGNPIFENSSVNFVNFSTINSNNTVVEIGKTYKITYTISNKVGNSAFGFFLGGWNVAQYQDVGTHSEIISVSSSSVIYIRNGNSNSSVTIDNCSVREVAQDWDLGTGWSIGEDKALANLTSSNDWLSQTNVFTSGKIYKVSFEVLDYTSGSINLSLHSAWSQAYSANGVYTNYLTATGVNLKFSSLANNFNGSITNISVKEVGMDWDILNDVASFSFENGIANIQGTANSANNGIKQVSISAVIGKTYKISATLRSNDGGLYRFRLLDGSYFDLGSGNSTEFETITSYHTATSTAFTIFATSWYTSGTSNFDISNISVIEITDDTNLPRISYENFSYQDALGSEEVVNGSFDTDTAWSKGTGWSIANGTASHIGGSASYLSQSILEADTQYKVDISVTEVSGGGFVQIYMGGSPASVLIQNVGEYEYIFTSQPSIGLGFALRGAGNVGIDNVSVKEYLGQEVVPNSGTASVLLESQSTNLITYSEDFSDASWLKDDVIISSDLTISPSGKSNSSIVVVNTAASRHNFKVAKAGVNTATLSIFAKAKELSYIQIASANNVNQFANFDLSNGTIGSVGSSFSDAKIENYGNGWYRCSVVSNNQYSQAIFSLVTSSTSPWLEVWTSANNTDGLYFWGAQLEQLSHATSYIPTSGTIATRLADSVTGAGSSDLINSTEGVLYAEIAALTKDSSYKLISLKAIDFNNRIEIGIGNNNKIHVYLVSNSATLIGSTSQDFTIDEVFKVALKWSNTNGCTLYINGSKITTAGNSTFSALDFNALDFNNFYGNPFFGKTKALAVFNEALTDSELECLTKI